MTEFIRAIVRPFLAVVSLGGLLLLILLRIPVPDAYLVITGQAMTFYFVYRHEEKKNGTP